MKYKILFLFVVSATASIRDATEEKINQKHSVENLLSRFSFNPFTPFPELLTTTSPSSERTGTTTTRPVLRIKTKKQSKEKIRRFPVFVAVEPTSTRSTILSELIETDDKIIKLKNTKSAGKLHTNRKTNSESQLSDKEWIASILSRTTTRRPTTEPNMIVKEKTLKNTSNQKFIQNEMDSVELFAAQTNKDFSTKQLNSGEQPSKNPGQRYFSHQTENSPYPEVFTTNPNMLPINRKSAPPDVEQSQYSTLALKLFQNRALVPSEEFKAANLDQSVFQQQVSQQNFLEKNRHRLFAQLPAYHQESQHQHLPAHHQQSQHLPAQHQNSQQLQIKYPQSQQSQIQQGLSFNSLTNNFQTQF